MYLESEISAVSTAARAATNSNKSAKNRQRNLEEDAIVVADRALSLSLSTRGRRDVSRKKRK